MSVRGYGPNHLTILDNLDSFQCWNMYESNLIK